MKRIISIAMSAVMLIFMLNDSVIAENNKTFFLVLGDSIAYGSGLVNSKEACYGKIVADSNGYDYSNYAVPGHTSSDLINKLSEESVITNLKKADIISISIGGNDFLTDSPSDLIFDALLENDYSRFDEIAINYYRNLSEIVSIINYHNDNAVILLQNQYNPQSGELKDIYQQGADRINSSIAQFDAENPNEIIIVDVASALNNNPDNFAEDGIHPSAKGNELIAQTILDILYSLNLGSSRECAITEEGIDTRGSLLLNLTIKILTFVVKVLVFLYKFA